MRSVVNNLCFIAFGAFLAFVLIKDSAIPDPAPHGEIGTAASAAR